MGTREERYYVAWAMVAYGGGFVHNLGLALFAADSENATKIKTAWPEYWAKYLDIGLKNEGTKL